ncbi:MAG: dimethylglycine dehydrogenase [Parasphingorhabdus sp.]|jgi:dimethylglycine dehydrogenase
MLGAAYTPTDVHLDASGATHTMAKAARKRGAKIARQCLVEAMVRDGDDWMLSTTDGMVRAKQVVIANSFWAREMAIPLGLNLPVFAVKHQAINSDNMPGLE